MTPTQLRFRAEFGEDAGDRYYFEKLTLFEARGKAMASVGSYRPSAGHFDLNDSWSRDKLRGLLKGSSPAAAPPASPKAAYSHPPVGSGQLAALLLREFGAVKGAEFIRRGLTFMGALDESVAEHLAKFGPPSKTGPTSKAAGASNERKGLAGRIRFAGGVSGIGKALKPRSNAQAAPA